MSLEGLGGDVLCSGLYGLALGASAWRAWRARLDPRRAAGGRALAAATVLVAIGVGEIALRLGGWPTARGRALAGCPLDDELGWSCAQPDGDASTTGPRALVIGDSFTGGAGVAPGARYYDALRDELGMEVWVRASSGWGTLQELLALERDVDAIGPDLVVLQICANDFINNSWELESASYANNNLSRRPYWEAGHVVQRQPSRFAGPARALAAHSVAAAHLTMLLQRLSIELVGKWRLPSVEERIHREHRAWAAYARSLATTEELLHRFARRCRPARVLAVPADAIEPYAADWRELLARQGVPLMRLGLARLQEATRAGECVTQPDGTHWNARGHQIVGHALAQLAAGVAKAPHGRRRGSG